MNNIYINSWLTPADGRRLIIKKQEFSRTDRTASARLVKDINAIKHNYIMDYSIITGANIELFEAVYDLHQELTLQIHHEHKDPETKIVMMKPFDRERLLCVNGTLWTGFVCELEEV
jgi:carbonic anhydrase